MPEWIGFMVSGSILFWALASDERIIGRLVLGFALSVMVAWWVGAPF